MKFKLLNEAKKAIHQLRGKQWKPVKYKISFYIANEKLSSSQDKTTMKCSNKDQLSILIT
uniref:Uncharacterized protein n=1 Tax=Arundo donax TaxID=35708 RepID=A0A0A9DFR1_ARUDO